jgi:hypothetical protein
MSTQAGENSLQKLGDKSLTSENAGVSLKRLCKCEAARSLRVSVSCACAHQRQNARHVAGRSRVIKPALQL